MGLGGAVLPRADHVQCACGGLGAGLTDEKILETGSKRRDGNGLEERTPFHGGSLTKMWGKGKPPKDSGGGRRWARGFTGGRQANLGKISRSGSIRLDFYCF